MRGDCSIRIDGLGFTPEEIAACAERKGLLSLEIDLAHPGPCQCAACQSTPQTAGSVLSLNEIRGLLDQARELGARRCLLVDSEETSYPELSQLIDDIRGKAMQVELFANAAAITKPTAEFLRQRDVAVILKIDNEQTQAAIKNLKQAGYGSAGNPRLAIRIEVSEENLPEIPQIWRLTRREGLEPYVQIITPRKILDENPKVVPSGQGRQLFEELARIDEMEFGRKWKTPPALTGRSCKRHLFACHVTSCGNIFACVGVTIPLGNIRVEPLREILDLSEVLENIRAFGQFVKEPCRTCCQTTDCYGCRGAAYQLTGDYLAGDQLCWKADNVKMETLPFDVKNLIPHGKSMRAIDQIVQIGERNARTEVVIRQDSLLVDASGRLDELAYIEMIAQSFAASHGFHLSEEDRRIHRGLLLGVKDFAAPGHARVGDRLTVIIRKVTRFGDFGVVEGAIYHQNGTIVASAQVKIWRPSNEVLTTVMT